MKRLIENVKRESGAETMLVSGLCALPFVGIGLLMCNTTATAIFGTVFLVLGVALWATLNQ